MATRKTAPKGRKPRTGLRSQVKASEEEAAWNSVETTEDEEGATSLPRVSQKSSPPSTKSVTPDATAGEGMISLMRRFLDNQEQREERYLQELRGLRESIVQSIRPAETSLDAESVRLELPTPAPKVSTRQRPAYIQDSPNVTAPREPTHWADPKMPSFQQGEDIENYLRRFERLARTWRWPEEEWSYRLVPLLTGQALEAYLAMDEERAEVYTDLKEALLEKINISPETYRQRFRSTTVPAGESPTETYNRLKNLYKRWVRPEEHSKEEIGEAIILEQLLRVLPYDARTWVREHEPRSGLAAAKLAQQYLNAHRSGPRTQQPKGTVRGVSHNSGSERGRVELSDNAQGPKSTTKDLLCFYCQQPGHKAAVCPARKAKLTGFCYVPREGDCDFDSVGESQNVYDVTVNGHELKALLDTGSSLSMVKSCFVNNVNYVNATSVQCVHGDIKQYPRAEEWKVPPSKEPETSLLVRKVEVEEEEESEDAKRQPSVVSLTHLEDSKREELQHLLNEFPALFCQRPGRTELAQHTIHLSDPSPSRQHPYRVPERLVEPLKEEIKMMKELGVIEPSTSEWSSPMTVTNPVPWTDDCETAFNALKDKMCSSPVLQSPDFSQRFLVQVDASATGIGAVLAM
ncbi:zinc finger with KRAB and SCAN domains 3-like protein [Labeo rohita]|uniref:Zinc finger with KRAB and SCAN domains 3-like protein n=1 Tax=Labeo rohita TaxID=84645 RepID=A0A498MQU4_LABRO|nr:zinc finger with KRAB and SCAN domains 3-like protein [Labeo rohita]